MPENPKAKNPARAKAAAKRRNWTVMVYLGGDNNLSEHMVTTLKSLRNAGMYNRDEIYIAACYDSVYPTVRTSFYLFDEEAGADGEKKKEVFDFRVPGAGHSAGDKEPDTAQQLPDFVKWCAENCPAENYCLILSGHGDAFRGKTLMFDESPSTALPVDKLRTTLDKARKHLPVKNGRRRFAVLGFDNCAMSTIEVAFEFRDVADHMIASEGWVPESGWEYEGPLHFLVDDPKCSAKDLADKFVTDFIDYEYDYAIGGRSVDLGVCNLKTLEKDNKLNVVTCLGTLGTVLSEIFRNVPPKPDEIFAQNLFKKLITNAHWNAQTFFYEQTVDIYDFCKCLIDECKGMEPFLTPAGNGTKAKGKKTESIAAISEQIRRVIHACEAVLSTKDFFVSNKVAGPAFRFSEGVSVFMPWSRVSFLSCRDTYKRTRFYKDQSSNCRPWYDFIDQFTKATMRTKSEASPQRSDFEYSASANGSGAVSVADRKSGGMFKTGGMFRGEIDILKDHFSTYKNYDIRWQVKE